MAIILGNQDNLTDVLVTWTPSEGATGYVIFYEGGSSDIVGLQGGSTENYLLTGLVPDTSYTITIKAISDHFSSLPVQITTLGKFKLVTHMKRRTDTVMLY